MSDWISEEVSSGGQSSPENRLYRHLCTLDASFNRHDQATNGAGTASSGVYERQENVRLERTGDVDAALGPIWSFNNRWKMLKEFFHKRMGSSVGRSHRRDSEVVYCFSNLSKGMWRLGSCQKGRTTVVVEGRDAWFSLVLAKCQCQGS